MDLGDFLALVGLIVSAFMYISFVRNERGQALSASRYFLASHQGTDRQFGPSFAAASTSLATVLIFFVAATPTYGVYLFWCGITYFIGQFLFLRFMKNGGIPTSSMTTNARFWCDETKGVLSANSIRTMTIFSFLMILFLELYIGSEIINYYTSAIGLPKIIGFAFAVIIVMIYVRFGGMNVVLQTDRWQYYLMALACILLFIVAIGFGSNSSNDASSGESYSLLSVNVTTPHLIVFLVWIGIQNVTLPFTQLSSWQRLASMQSVDTAINGFKAVGLGFFILWFLPVIALLIFDHKGADIAGVGGLFDIIKSLDGFIISTVFAVIFVGFASALFSTADSAMIALELSVAEQISESSDKNIHLPKIKLNIIMLAIAGGLVLTYWLVESKILTNFLNIIYVLFAQLAIIAPHMLLALIRRNYKMSALRLSRTGDIITTLGIWLAWLTLMAISLLPDSFGVSPDYAPMVGMFVSVTLSAASLMLAIVWGASRQPTDLVAQEDA